MSLLVNCIDSLLLMLNYIAANICVNTFRKQRNNLSISYSLGMISGGL
jgi:hypothetical protein